MASYTLTTGQIAAHNKTTVAATVDTVTFPGHCAAVEVISNGADELSVTTDGSAPTSGGAKTYRLPAGALCVRVVPSPTSGVTVVKLISPGVVTYSVTGPV